MKLDLEFAGQLHSLVFVQSCWANYFGPIHETTLPTLFNTWVSLNSYHYLNYSHGSNRKAGIADFKRSWSDFGHFSLELLLRAATAVAEYRFILLRIMQFMDSS